MGAYRFSADSTRNAPALHLPAQLPTCSAHWGSLPQASIIGYMVSSFFASVAYQWFIYYLIAYAVAFRRTYSLEAEKLENEATQLAMQPA